MTTTTAAGLPREAVPCDLCQTRNHERFLCEAKSLYSEERFRIVTCRRCGLIYVNPRQQETAKLAQIAALSGCGDVEERQERDEDVYDIVLNAIERHRRGGSLLDIGAATGGLLRAARDRGWQVTGVEAAKPLAEFGARTYGLRIIGGTLEEARFPDAAFDAVIMVHTIEHLYHPSKVVAEVFRILKPGGLFYSMTPDFNRYAVRLVQRLGLMKDFDRIDPTAHPYYFTPRTHAALVRRQGFRVVSCGSPMSGQFARRNGHRPSWQTRLLGAAAQPAIWLSQVAPIGSSVQCLAQRPVHS